MSAVAPGKMTRVMSLWDTTIGKKAVMAVTGVILFGYVIAHVLGNLQFFLGPEKINAYARFLHSTPSLLWGTRVVLLVSVLFHIVAAAQLKARARAARPIAYRMRRNVDSSYASRSMILSGFVLAGFIVFHLLDLTTGHANPDFVPGDVYGNVMATFSRAWAAALYVVSMVALASHLYHGVWSLFQSLGASHPAYTPRLKRFAVAAAILIALGFVSIPVAVVAGVVK